jgi:hypothetical protein
MSLHRYWFRFSGLRPFASVRLGCGVTAYSYDDAVDVLSRTVFAQEVMPAVESVLADVDVTTLDPRHVIPNMDPTVWRGVWFPKGYVLRK